MTTWYVDSNRSPVNWISAVSGGVAQTNIYRIVQDDTNPWPLEYLWAAEDTSVPGAAVTAAQAEESDDPVADAYTAPDTGNSYDHVLVLDEGQPIPAGIPAETVIVRKTP